MGNQRLKINRKGGLSPLIFYLKRFPPKTFSIAMLTNDFFMAIK